MSIFLSCGLDISARTCVRTVQDAIYKMHKIGETYIIKGNIDLEKKTLIIPQDSKLIFRKGNFTNGSIVFNNTTLDATINSILDVAVSGTVTNPVIFPEWFHDKSLSYSLAIQRAIDLCSSSKSTIEFTRKEYRVSGNTIKLKSNITLHSNVSSRLFTNELNNYKAIFYQDISCNVDSVTFDGLFFDQSFEVATEKVSKVQLFCILLYKASNITVKNCRFDHIGTNAIVVNGPQCYNTIIENNEICFLRLREQGYYDVSSIYVNDASHHIKNNHIFNSGASYDEQSCAIESHGPIGEIEKNFIENCHNAINLVSSSPDEKTWSGIYNKKIWKNTVEGCDNFVIFWPLSGQSIANVSILENLVTGCKTAIGITPGSQYSGGSMEDIEIRNNDFCGFKTEITNERSTASRQHLFRYEAISLQNYGNIDGMEIHNNTFSDFPAIILDVNVYSKPVITKVQFHNNIIRNCLNGVIVEPLTLKDRFAVFVVGPNSETEIYDNVIETDGIDKSIEPKLLYTHGKSTLCFHNNENHGAQIKGLTISKQTKVIE